jgi:hypothetical protein
MEHVLPKLGKDILPNIGRERIRYLFLGRNTIFHGLKALAIKAGEGYSSFIVSLHRDCRTHLEI